MGRGAALGLACLALAGCGRDSLPPELTIERAVTMLAPPLAPGAKVEEPAAGAAHRALLQPGDRGGPGAPRDAILAPPPARLAFRVEIPADAVLRFSVGVEGDKQRDTSKGGIDFRVLVDGEQAFDETVNPAYRRRDRRWLDVAVDLAPWAGRTVDVVLETHAEDPGRALAGMPGWANVRVLRRDRRPRQAAGAAPNVLVLLVDTLRADRLGAYGAQPSPSPALDGFAARGTVFDVAVAQASWTMPSVASIFTGLHPRSHGAVGPDQDDGATAGGTFLADDLVTLAELAEDAGISTVGVSTNVLVGRSTNLAQGFETFVELPFDDEARNYPPAEVVNREFLDWLDRATGARFLAYLHYMEAHGPYAPPVERRPPPPPGMRGDLAAGDIHGYARKVNAGQAPPPSPAEIAHLRALYDGDVRSWDDSLASLLAALEGRGLLRNTVVVVLADHGEEFLEHGALTHGKHLYEETVRVPLILVGPGITAGRRGDIAQGIDLLPTLAGILGVRLPLGLPGRDLFATDTADGAVSEIVSALGEAGNVAGTVALRTPRWKLIRSPAPAGVELYDLQGDPGERVNLAGAAGETGLLDARLEAWAKAAPAAPHNDAVDPSLRDKLRKLGYVD